MKPVLVETIKLSKSFTIDCERNDVIDELDLKINSNEFLCILGYTGCGKSTLLRILAGFESPDEGDVLIAGTSHHSPTRDVIMIFATTIHINFREECDSESLSHGQSL